MSGRSLLPWEKTVGELSGYDWGSAVGMSSAHRDKPTDLRIAAEMVRFTSGDLMLAWPTIRTLSEYTNTHRVTATKAITRLKKSGALHVYRIAELKPEIRKEIGRSGRGSVYGMNMEWAFQVFEMRQVMKRKEPEGLKIGREKEDDCGRSNVANSFTLPPKSNVACAATSIVADAVALVVADAVTLNEND